MVSHDLRMPLSSISNSLGLILAGSKGPINAKQQTSLEKAQANVARLSALIDELIDLERLESGKMVMNLGFTSAYDACQEAVRALKAFAGKQKVIIIEDLEDFGVLADERRLVQVLTNLLSNAIKFSPPRSTVRVSVGLNNEFVEFLIDDEGPGVPDEYKALIFRRFAQTSANVSAIKGTGLGLAISKAIVESHGGAVGVKDNNPRGSRFWVRIPRHPSEMESPK